QYAAFRPTYPPELFAYLAGLCAERRLAWDCACGNGQASVPLAQHFQSVVASDASAEQIGAATPHPRVSYRVAAESRSGLEADSVDLVTVAQALHWLDLERFYAETARVLRPSGWLAVWTYGVPRAREPDIDSAIGRFASETVGPYWPPERALVDSGYRTLAFPFAEQVAPPFHMEQRWSLPHFLGYARSWSATARYLAEKRVDPVLALAEELERIWGIPESERAIIWPLSLRVGARASPST
ncbi:MAG TPA: class I SAM-dependent methyltransferase, partial [Polyangiales bacterium]|nr:class I SAM-dependent methyltransferase [Polyangiales bacterium]